jgi:hypothetical protein
MNDGTFHFTLKNEINTKMALVQNSRIKPV